MGAQYPYQDHEDSGPEAGEANGLNLLGGHMCWSGVAQPGWGETFDQAPPAGLLAGGPQREPYLLVNISRNPKGLVRDHWPGQAGHHSTSREGWSTMKNLEAGVAAPEP